MPRLLVLQHMEREGPGLFLKIAEARDMQIKIIRLYLGEDLPQVSNGDLLLILGGSMGVRDINDSRYPWLSKEISIIKHALSNQIPIIGVCLGAQLLSYAAGGDTEILVEAFNNKPSPEVGWGNIYIVDKDNKDSESYFLGNSFKVLHWHGDRILLPSTAQLIASSEYCKEQFFKIGTSAYGMQFHLEIDDQMVLKWIQEDEQFIKSALGEHASSILQRQQKQFGDETSSIRLEFLNKLFDKMGF